ncbi:MAG: HAMP domain-containing histidine kinase [Acidimicrobiia bacterium]|nr:HAMP domain-containing histidine kinase [Acidimicrobiia bacterium]
MNRPTFRSFRRHSESQPKSSRRDRPLLITIGAGLILLLVVGIVFSAAWGSQQITKSAAALHNADETLRSATVARAQLALAVHMSAVDREFGTNSLDAREVSRAETRKAILDMDDGFADLAASDNVEIMPIASNAVDEFTGVVEEIQGLLDGGDSVSAQLVAEESLDSSFRGLMVVLVDVRNDLFADIETSDGLLILVGNVSRFLVAFLIPAAIILIYQRLASRARRQAELEARLDAERRLSQAREEFIANASHELRTPLTGIHGLAMLLEDDPAIQSSEVASEFVGMIVSESADLSRMVEDLLTTARLDAGALTYSFSDVDVPEEVREVIEPMRRADLEASVHCDPGVIRADHLRFRQILRNLLSNARKYGGAKIWIEGRVVGRSYELVVADNGPGLPKELENRVFERFIHQDQKTAVKDSVGLGLSIVRALADGMSGSVDYERRPGETRFVVTMPLTEPDSAVSPFRDLMEPAVPG